MEKESVKKILYLILAIVGAAFALFCTVVSLVAAGFAFKEKLEKEGTLYLFAAVSLVAAFAFMVLNAFQKKQFALPALLLGFVGLAFSVAAFVISGQRGTLNVYGYLSFTGYYYNVYEKVTIICAVSMALDLIYIVVCSVNYAFSKACGKCEFVKGVCEEAAEKALEKYAAAHETDCGDNKDDEPLAQNEEIDNKAVNDIE